MVRLPSGPEEEVDVIIIGAGPNGLTAGGYLAKAGADVVLFDKRAEVGGGLNSDDFGTEFKYNNHATYMMMAELAPVHDHFNLEKRGIEYIRPEAQVGFAFDDDTSLVLYTDPEKSAESIGSFSKNDQSAFLEMYREFEDLLDEIIIPQTYVHPKPPLELHEMLEDKELGEELLEISELTPLDIIDRYGFENEKVRAAMLYLSTIWMIHPEAGGTGYMVPLFVNRMQNAALVKNGSHMLASKLYEFGTEAGMAVEDYGEVTEIIVEDGEAKGVKLQDGREYRASTVISTLDPKQTFIEMIDEEDLADLGEKFEDWEYDEWSLYTHQIGIKGNPPKLKAAEDNPDLNDCLIQVMGYNTVEGVTNHINEMEKGNLPEPAGHLTTTSKHDPMQKPSGKWTSGDYGPLHTLRWETWAPYELSDGNWDERKREYMEENKKKLNEYITNLSDSIVLHEYAFSPLDVERRLTSMREGAIKHGAYISTQMGHLRPDPDLSSNRTPIDGLYLGGASVYPGGMITFGPAYNVARAVSVDQDLDIWWKPPKYMQEAEEKGYIEKSAEFKNL